MSHWRWVRYALYLLAFPVIFLLAKLVPKAPLVVFCCASRHSYADNTRYIFEYMIDNPHVSVRWLTDSADIDTHITSQGGRVISMRRPFTLCWVLLRARVLVDSGDGKFDPFWITSLSRTKLISTLHGCGPKVTLSRDTVGKPAIRQMKNLLRYDYVNFPSDHAGEWIGGRIYNLPNEKIINLGYPRCDQLVTAKVIPTGQRPRKICKSMVPDVGTNSTVILYTPTWRTYDYELPLLDMDGIDISAFDEWLGARDAYLFLTVHSVNIPCSIPQGLSRFCFISGKDWPLFDVSAFMAEVDILVNDYSTTSVDFAHTGRPQIAFMPDYKRYKAAKGFTEEYRDTLVGPEVTDIIGFQAAIDAAISKPTLVAKPYEKARQRLLHKYNEVQSTPSVERWAQLIEKLCR